MKRIGRKRRLTAWTLFAFALLVAGVWVLSGFSSVGYSETGSAWFVRAGLLSHYNGRDDLGWYVNWFGRPFDVRWRVIKDFEPSMDYNFRLAAWTKDGQLIQFAVWPIPLLLVTPAALFLRSASLARRRANANACAKCGYNLTGLATGTPCPECGASS